MLASAVALALVLLSVVLVTLTQAARLEPDVDLGDVDASFWGENAGDEAGWSISDAGDVDGDGYEDLLIGAYLNDEAITNTGQTYLLLGGLTTEWSMDVSLGTNADASFQGEGEGDRSGHAVSGAGDVDGDGYDDFLVGAPENDAGGANSGQVYLIRGRPTVSWTTDVSLALADGSFIGEAADDQAGRSVAGAGDVNADGYDDFLIGAPYNTENGSEAGQTYLILGRPTVSWTMDLALSDDADASLLGENNQCRSGWAVAAAGDVNADGYDDLLIGAPGAIGQGRLSRAYLVLGRPAISWTVGMTLAAHADATFVAEGTDQYCGWGLSGAGDVNRDGYDDLLVGCWGNDEGGTDAGQTYLILGRPTTGWTGVMSLGVHADASFVGEAAADWSALAVSDAGDVNRDGYDDFLIGAYGNDEPGDSNAGQAYLILGRAAADWGMDLDLANADASYWGETTADLTGNSVSGAGDVNRDGYDDFLVGARGANSGSSDKIGQTYLILGNGLELAKRSSSASTTPGQVLTYSMLYSNTMPITATGVVITERIPADTVYQGCDGGGSCNQSGGLVSWTLGDLASSATGAVTLTVQVTTTLCEDTVLTNTAYLSSTNGPNTLAALATSTVIVTPTAAFSSDSPVCLGTTMQFADTSQCASTWAWDFGDGTGSSNEPSPGYLYTGADDYTVTLTVTNASGHSDSHQDSVTVNPVPTAAFSSNTPVCLGEPVVFDNQSTGAASFLWSFGDGASSSDEDPSHSYAAPGTFTVVLTATSATGCVDVVSHTVTVSSLPGAAFSSNAPVCLGEPVVFDNQSTGAASFLWSFGDGISISAGAPSHSYAAPGTYTVVLTATNATGCIDVVSHTVTVGPLPAAGFVSNSPVYAYETMVFTNTSVGASTSTWDFGDGVGTSTDEHPVYSYTQVGSYTVTLTAFNTYGCSDVYTALVSAAYRHVYLPLAVRDYVPSTPGAVGHEASETTSWLPGWWLGSRRPRGTRLEARAWLYPREADRASVRATGLIAGPW
jgi:uncharacterized repeat protein (TIGR01451 family)